MEIKVPLGSKLFTGRQGCNNNQTFLSLVICTRTIHLSPIAECGFESQIFLNELSFGTSNFCSSASH